MSEVARFGALMAAGASLPSALSLTGLSRQGASPVEQMLFFAIQSGAPIKKVASQLASFEFDLERFRSELASANAVPIATRKLMLWLPALSLVVGQLAGFGTIVAIFHPLGIAALVVALALIAFGIRWSGSLLAPLLVEPQHPALELMKVSLQLTSGAPLRNANQPEVAELVAFSKATGAPLSQLVQNEIELVTQRSLQHAMIRAKRMSIELLIPMSLTVLPAFLILTIVPMLIGFGL